MHVCCNNYQGNLAKLNLLTVILSGDILMPFSVLMYLRAMLAGFPYSFSQYTDTY